MLWLVIAFFVTGLIATVIALKIHDKFCQAKYLHDKGTVERKTWWTLLG